MLIQPPFPPHRRQEPMRLAELAVYTELANSDREGRALYELKTSRTVPELDFTVMLENFAIYGLQVKGGQHQLHRAQWQVITADGPENIPDPMMVTWDAAMQIRATAKRLLHRKVFVVAVLVFPDMEPDPDIEIRAENDRVKILFGSDDLVERLINLIDEEDIFSPPTAWQVDELAEALMPFLGNGVEQPEIPDLCNGARARVPRAEATPMEPMERAGAGDLTGLQPMIRHADTVNVFNGPVTLYQGAPAAEAHVQEQEVSVTD